MRLSPVSSDASALHEQEVTATTNAGTVRTAAHATCLRAVPRERIPEVWLLSQAACMRRMVSTILSEVLRSKYARSKLYMREIVCGCGGARACVCVCVYDIVSV